jgi:hypothetical protein
LSTARPSQNMFDDLSSDVVPTDMPCRPRIELGGFMDLVMAPGNAQPQVVRDESDRRHLISGLEETVVRHGLKPLCHVMSLCLTKRDL